MSPRIPIDPEILDEYGVADVAQVLPGFIAARDRMVEALARLGRVDPVTAELCRLLNADLQQCKVCMRHRYTDTSEQVLSAARDYEHSELLTERQKLALRLCELYLRNPSVPDGALRTALLAEFSAEEIVELLLGQVRYTWNKALVALGLDGQEQRG